MHCDLSIKELLPVNFANGGINKMRKMVLLAALLLTISNISVGVYAATCTGRGGGRVCGSTCGKNGNGDCVCEGTCSSAEMNWVAGDPPPAPIAEEEIYDY